jgi:hypothetical protein
VDGVPLLVDAGGTDRPALADAAAGLDRDVVLDDPAGGDGRATTFDAAAEPNPPGCGAGLFGVGRVSGLEGAAGTARRRRGRF